MSPLSMDETGHGSSYFTWNSPDKPSGLSGRHYGSGTPPPPPPPQKLDYLPQMPHHQNPHQPLIQRRTYHLARRSDCLAALFNSYLCLCCQSGVLLGFLFISESLLEAVRKQ